MRLLFSIDTKDYNPNGIGFVRHSARCIAIRNGRVAMIHSEKHNYYKFPGGGFEKGETKEQSAIREMKEETGLTVVPSSIKEYGYVHRVTGTDKPGYDYFVQDNYFYLCEVEEEVGNQALDRNEAEEGITLEWVDPDYAIYVNNNLYHGPNNAIMILRDSRVLEQLKREGYFDAK